jgi:outer membrane protein TolC
MDVYRAQIRLKDTQDRLNRTQEALQGAQDQLKLILSFPVDKSLYVTAKMTYYPLMLTIEKALETAFENRMELDQAADEIENLERSSRVARHHIKPRLDLVGHYNHLGLEEPFESGSDTKENYWSIGLVSTTDWRRTSEKADYQRSLLAVKAAKLNRWTLIDTIRREVRQRFDALLKSEERMRIRKEQMQQAKGKLALAQVKFNHDMADNFDVIEAQTELQSARTNMLAAEIEHIVGRYHLRAVMGTLLEYRENDSYN